MATGKRFRYLILFLIVAVGFFTYRKISFSQEGFSKDKISSSLAPSAAWSVPSASPQQKQELRTIFSSRFKFLGEGAQAFAFESEDGKYVLKFFKMRRFTPSLEDHLCPLVVKRRLKNLRWVFNGYKTAYDELRQDTGLIFIHLAKTGDLQQTAVVVDEKGQEHAINLDATEFVLQEKAELLFSRVAKLYQQGDQKGAERAIDSVLDLVKRRIAKGYADRDKAVSNNFGFVGDRPIQLDTGRLYKGAAAGQLEHVQRRIEQWKSEELTKGEISSAGR